MTNVRLGLHHTAPRGAEQRRCAVADQALGSPAEPRNLRLFKD